MVCKRHSLGLQVPRTDVSKAKIPYLGRMMEKLLPGASIIQSCPVILRSVSSLERRCAELSRDLLYYLVLLLPLVENN